MGQAPGKMPDTWNELMTDKRKTLDCSSQILAKVDDNVMSEDTFLTDYDNDEIDRKVAQWLEQYYTKFEKLCRKNPNVVEKYRPQLFDIVDKVSEEVKATMRKDYQSSYGDLKKFTQKVDKFGEEQRRIHGEIQQAEKRAEGQLKKFQKSYAPLRAKVYGNLKIGEKMLLEDQKLKASFSKKINDIDKHITTKCQKKFDKAFKEFEKNVKT